MIIIIGTLIVFYSGYFMGFWVLKNRWTNLLQRIIFEEGFVRGYGYEEPPGKKLDRPELATKEYLKYLEREQRR